MSRTGVGAICGEQMTVFISTLIGGVTLGGIFALISIGMVLIFRATEVFNFAHGQMMLLAAFILGRWDGSMPIYLLLLLDTVIIALVGVIFYLGVLQWMVGRPMFLQVIATFGFAAVLDGAMLWIFGSNTYVANLPFLPSGSIKVVGTPTSSANLVVMAISLALGLIVIVGLRYTRIGVQVRASGQNALLASQSGIRIHSLFASSWAVAGALAAVAGICYGATNVVSFSVEDVALLAIPAMLVGGLDSISGALIGGLLVGLLESFVSSYVGGDVVDGVTWAVLLVVLLVRPRGLLGSVQVVRV